MMESKTKTEKWKSEHGTRNTEITNTKVEHENAKRKRETQTWRAEQKLEHGKWEAETRTLKQEHGKRKRQTKTGRNKTWKKET